MKEVAACQRRHERAHPLRVVAFGALVRPTLRHSTWGVSQKS